MADKKISQLTGGGAAQATDEYVIARSGNNFKVTGANVAAAATSVGTLTSLTVSGNATFNTNTLFVDAANNRVGVGIVSSLASVLHIKGPAGSNPATGGIVFQYSTNSSNYGAIGLDNATGSFAILAGSGAELRFHTNSDLATSNLRWRMDTNGHFLANADNSFDIGASGANRPRNVFVAGNVTAGGNISIPSGNVLYLSGPAGGEYLQVSGGSLFLGTAGSGRVQVNASGNVGVGVTPSAWSVRALQVGATTAIWQESASTFVSANVYFDGSNRYISTAAASRYEQNAGSHRWFTAPSGTAGNAITFTQAMTLDASGNLGIGAASLSSRLAVVASGTPPTPPAQTIAQFYRSGDAFIDVTSFNGNVSGIRFGDNADSVYARISLNRTTNALGFLNNGVERWQISSDGHFLAGTDNSFDIGAAGASRPRNVFVGGNVVVTGDFRLVNSYSRVADLDNSGGFGGGYNLYIDVTTPKHDSTGPISGFYYDTSGNVRLFANSSQAAATNAQERVRVKPGGQVRFVPLASAPTTSVEDGDVYYDSGTNKLRVRAGGAWTDLH